MPRTSNRAIIASVVVAVASASLIVTDAAFAGCGGRHRNQQGQQDDQGQGGGDGHRRHRGNRDNQGADNSDDGGGNSGNRGRRQHHRWRPGDTGPDTTLGVGIGGTYGVPGGRIGPPTRACAESQHAQSQLNRLRNLRAEISSGRKVLTPGDNGGTVVVKVARLRREAGEDALLGSGGAGAMNNFDQQMQAMRDASLAAIDADIRNLEYQLEQLAAQCR